MYRTQAHLVFLASLFSSKECLSIATDGRKKRVLLIYSDMEEDDDTRKEVNFGTVYLHFSTGYLSTSRVPASRKTVSGGALFVPASDKLVRGYSIFLAPLTNRPTGAVP